MGVEEEDLVLEALEQLSAEVASLLFRLGGRDVFWRMFEAMKRGAIRSALEQTWQDGHRSERAAARLLGVSRNTLRRARGEKV